jgi:AcrR family transcriptional regulator
VVARTANDTRDKLIVHGQRLFAEQGVFRVPLRLVVEQAGQKNSSALHYHFGGREGLLQAILERHNETIEAERAEMLAALRADHRTNDIAAITRSIVLPFARKLDTADGREFLRIVAQLSDLFDSWQLINPQTPPQVQAAFFMLAAALDHLPQPMRHERVTTFLMLVSNTLALRARQIELSRPVQVSTEVFITNLIDMSVGALQAPSSYRES